MPVSTTDCSQHRRTETYMETDRRTIMKANQCLKTVENAYYFLQGPKDYALRCRQSDIKFKCFF